MNAGRERLEIGRREHRDDLVGPAGTQLGGQQVGTGLVFVLGLVSVLMLWPLGFLAWIMGNKAMRDVRDRPGVYENENLIVAGRILGIVAAVLTILFAVFFVGMMVLGLTVPLLVAMGIGAACVRPGGALVYVVCSLLDAEGAVSAGPFLAETAALYYGYSHQVPEALAGMTQR